MQLCFVFLRTKEMPLSNQLLCSCSVHYCYYLFGLFMISSANFSAFFGPLLLLCAAAGSSFIVGCFIEGSLAFCEGHYGFYEMNSRKRVIEEKEL